jgi:NADPH2:quinone reductase
MRALLCKEYGPLERLTVEDVPSPALKAGQVLISVQAASVNYPDALIVQGKYQSRPPLPFVPGAECAGTVRAVGEGVKHLQVGAAALAFPGRGAFAEEVAVDANAVLALEPGVDPVKAAPLPMVYGTAYHALSDRAQLQSAETLLVLGAGGGVGLAAVELGKILGAKVIAAASTREKLDAAASRGADHVIDYSSEDLRTRLKEITGDKGVDVVCDPVGGAYTEPALRSTGWRGRYLVVGFAAGDIPRIALNLPLLKGSALVGVFWGEFMKREPWQAAAQLTQLVKWLREERLRPLVTSTYALENAREALAAVFERRATGKLLITIPSKQC